MLAAFLISADVPEEEIQKFLTVQNYEGWQRQDLVRALEKRLGSSYKVYMSEIKTMNKLMEVLAEILSLKNGDVSSTGLHWDVLTSPASSTGQPTGRAAGTTNSRDSE